MAPVGSLPDILRPTEIHDLSDLVQKPVRRVGLSFGIVIAILLLAAHVLKSSAPDLVAGLTGTVLP
jgi:hypothetical protein